MTKRKVTKKELFEIIERQKNHLQYLKETYVEPYHKDVKEKNNLKNVSFTGFYISDVSIIDYRLEELKTLRKGLKKYGKKRQTKK